MANGNGSQKPAQKEDFDLERFLKIVTAFSVAVGVVVYSFTLGYFHRLEVPGSPSFLEAIRFYVLSVLKNLYTNPLVGVGIIAMFGAVYLGAMLYKKKKDWKIVLGLIGCAIAFVLPLACLFKSISLFAPVILAVIFAMQIFLNIEDGKVDKQRKTVSLLVFFASAIALSLWAFSTLDLTFFDKSKLNTYFPNGFGVKDYEPSNLIWTEDGKRYWYSCQSTRGVIYGTGDEEKIFVRTEMSSTLYNHLCVSAE